MASSSTTWSSPPLDPSLPAPEKLTYSSLNAQFFWVGPHHAAGMSAARPLGERGAGHHDPALTGKP